MDSSFYRSSIPRLPAYSPPAFRALFGSPSAQTGKYEEIALGDQSFWWAIIKYMNSDQESQKGMFEHLHYDWEISSCLADMYITNMLPGQDDATEEDELKVQLHTWATPHQGEVIEPKLVHLYVSLLVSQISRMLTVDRRPVTVYLALVIMNGQAGTPPRTNMPRARKVLPDDGAFL